MSAVVAELRTGKEKTYHALAIAFGAIFWVLILWACWSVFNSGNERMKAVLSLYVFYAFDLFIFYFLSSAFYKANAYGNMLLLGPNQFSQLHAMVADGSRELGLSETPKTFIYNSNGLFNAFARRLLGGRYVFLTSALVEASDDEQIRFVIGHELGHHAAGHLNPWLNFVKLPAHVVPFLMPAYSRAREYSCDQIGAHLSKDAAVSQSALQMLGCGCRRLNTTMNCEAFMAQEAMVPPIFGFLNEIFRSHPRLTRRIAAIGLSKSGR